MAETTVRWDTCLLKTVYGTKPTKSRYCYIMAERVIGKSMSSRDLML